MSNDFPEKNKTKNQNIPKEYGILAKNSFFSFLNTYGTFIFSLISSFLLARLIDDKSWSYFVLGISYIQIVSLIVNFLPPSLKNTLLYYIPRFRSLEQKKRLKAFIKRAIYAKITFTIPIFVITIILFFFFSNIFFVNIPAENLNLLFLLSPLIIINNLQVVLNSINIAFNKFKLVFLSFSTQYLIYIAFLIYFLIGFGGINLTALAIIYVLASLIPFLINIIIITNDIRNIKAQGKSNTATKEDLKDMVKYGTLVRAATFFTELWGEIQVQSIGTFQPNKVLGFKISRDLLSMSVNTSLAIASPLSVSFSSFIAKEKKENIIAIYNLLIKYMIFLIEFLTGLLFFFADFFILLVYGEPRLIYSDLVKLYLFTFIFLIVASPLDSLLLAENKGNYLVLIRFIGLLLRLPLFLILVIFTELYIAFIGIIISNFLFSGLYLYVTIKIGNIKLYIRKIVFQFLIFFLSLGFTLVLEYFFLNRLNNLTLRALNPYIFNSFNLFSLIVFFLVFMFLIIEFRILKVSDITGLQSFFLRDTKLHKLTNKALNFLKRILKD